MLMFIIANALILKHVLTDEQIPQHIANSMLDAGFGPVMFLVIVNVILLIGGQFMEPSGLIVIVAPLVFPIAIELGIDPIHLGIIMVVNMEIGMITPPVGLNLFVTSRRGGHADDGGRQGGPAVPGGAVRVPDHGDLHPVAVDLSADADDGTRNYHQIDAPQGGAVS